MYPLDSGDESEHPMTRVSEVVEYGDRRGIEEGRGGATRNVSELEGSSDDEIGEMELLQLRSLVQEIKLQTVVGKNFMKNERGPSSSYSINDIVSPVTEEELEDGYKKLQRENCLLIAQVEKQAVRVRELEKLVEERGNGGAWKKAGEAAREMEMENLKKSHKQLQMLYTEKIEEAKKAGQPRNEDMVSLDDYNKLKEQFFELNKIVDEKDKKIQNKDAEAQRAQNMIYDLEHQLQQANGRIRGSNGPVAGSIGVYPQPNTQNWNRSLPPRR